MDPGSLKQSRQIGSHLKYLLLATCLRHPCLHAALLSRVGGGVLPSQGDHNIPATKFKANSRIFKGSFHDLQGCQNSMALLREFQKNRGLF